MEILNIIENLSLIKLIILYIGLAISIFTIGVMLLEIDFIIKVIRENDWRYKPGCKYNIKYLIASILTIPIIFILIGIVILIIKYVLN